jgi:hypothetical protein
MGVPRANAPYFPPVSPGYVAPIPQLTREQEVQALREHVRMMQENLEAAQERIDQLTTEKEG